MYATNTDVGGLLKVCVSLSASVMLSECVYVCFARLPVATACEMLYGYWFSVRPMITVFKSILGATSTIYMHTPDTTCTRVLCLCAFVCGLCKLFIIHHLRRRRRRRSRGIGPRWTLVSREAVAVKLKTMLSPNDAINKYANKLCVADIYPRCMVSVSAWCAFKNE